MAWLSFKISAASKCTLAMATLVIERNFTRQTASVWRVKTLFVYFNRKLNFLVAYFPVKYKILVWLMSLEESLYPQTEIVSSEKPKWWTTASHFYFLFPNRSDILVLCIRIQINEQRHVRTWFRHVSIILLLLLNS